jgi:hypothetical protein
MWDGAMKHWIFASEEIDCRRSCRSAIPGFSWRVMKENDVRYVFNTA